MMETKQQKFWKSNFGKQYTKRNIFNPGQLDKSYLAAYGMSRSRMSQEFLGGLKINNVLEIGCNVGNQLRSLQKQGYKDLFGIEIQADSVEQAKKLTDRIKVLSPRLRARG